METIKQAVFAMNVMLGVAVDLSRGSIDRASEFAQEQGERIRALLDSGLDDVAMSVIDRFAMLAPMAGGMCESFEQGVALTTLLVDVCNLYAEIDVLTFGLPKGEQ